ncbi:MAG TPA: hypothetical protein VGU44_05350, partial [Gammaproteobacteria bacterium]|nr:hypothetical protein [Gammaproteobacteria bacterium]
MEERTTNIIESFEKLISTFNSNLIEITAMISHAPVPLTQEQQVVLQKLFPFAVKFESIVFTLAQVDTFTEICAEMQELSTKFFQLAIAHGNKERIREMFYSRGNECQNLAKGKTLDSPERTAATRHYLLAASLAHPLAPQKIQEICKANPNKFCQTFAHDPALNRETLEHWGNYLIEKHFDELSTENQQLLQPIIEQRDASLLRSFKGLFFEGSSDDEKDKEM